MHPAVRVLGTLLRLVGISSPEDTASSPAAGVPAGPPSWRTPTPSAPPEARSTPPAPVSGSVAQPPASGSVAQPQASGSAPPVSGNEPVPSRYLGNQGNHQKNR